MRLYPYDRFVMQLASPPEAVIQELSAHTEPIRWVRRGEGHKPFEGTVSDSHFKIRRIIHYRNSFLPQIRGVLEPDSNGTRLTVEMTLHPLVLAFVAVWSLGVFVGLSVAVAAVVWGNASAGMPLIPLGMIGFAYGLTCVAFHVEARKARQLLERIVYQIEMTTLNPPSR